MPLARIFRCGTKGAGGLKGLVPCRRLAAGGDNGCYQTQGGPLVCYEATVALDVRILRRRGNPGPLAEEEAYLRELERSAPGVYRAVREAQARLGRL